MSLVTKNLTDTACRRPRRDRGRNYTAMSIALGTIAYVFVAIRLVFKRIRQRISTDDWVILTSLAVGIPCTIFNVHGLARNGMGKDVWTLAPGTIINFVLFFYLLEIFYITMMALVKIAICFFYLSIFHFTRMRQVLWATLGVNAMFGTAAVVTAIFQCTPVNYFWTQYLQREGGSCINIHALAWVHGAVNIAMNVWLIILPLSQVSRLELHWKKKLGVIVMFMVGMFDTVVSILRLRSLINFANTWNPTWDDWEVAWWSTIEINVGIICTCLPTLRLILVSVAPRIFGTGRNTPPGGSHHSSTRGIMVQTQLHITSAATTAAAAGPRTPDQLKAWELMADRGSRNHSVAYSAPQNT
ncbi:hypothetical protein HIM_09021 [Hirsutella minnesotensis 3608]|uniref:Rhodopsin domain-containing protein n=1 Tax=Hirsutella minnesotensis 3608 TaxID=1043627 RepID=A0A0F7ZY04_9HYPO|nr:hypothetical protein HIM_09021 [Hirsutella minnesotensis 3608]